MYQENLWAAPARSTGFTAAYFDESDGLGQAGKLVVQPAWHKRPSKGTGYWICQLDQEEIWHVPELLRACFGGWNTTHPEHTLPRDLSRALQQCRQDYQHYSEKKTS